MHPPPAELHQCCLFDVEVFASGAAGCVFDRIREVIEEAPQFKAHGRHLHTLLQPSEDLLHCSR